MPRQGNRPPVENPYKETPQIEAIKDTLHSSFFYTKREAKELAREIAKNLDNYLVIMEKARLPYNTARPTQTPYWKAKV